MLKFKMFSALVFAAAAGELPKAEVFLGPLMGVVNLAMYVLTGLLVGITGIKLIMSSIALSSAVGEQDRAQKKDDLFKCLKNFGITIAVTTAILVGGPKLIAWVEAYITPAPTMP